MNPLEELILVVDGALGKVYRRQVMRDVEAVKLQKPVCLDLESAGLMGRMGVDLEKRLVGIMASQS